MTRLFSLRSGTPCELLSVWTTWLNLIGSASAGTTVRKKRQRVAQSSRETRAPDRGYLKNCGEVKLIRFNGPYQRLGKNRQRTSRLSLSNTKTLLITEELQPHVRFV